jgi:integrator complex subunit 9
MKQHTILVNCPLKTRHVRQDPPDSDVNDEGDELTDYTTPLDNVLAPYHPLAKQVARYSTDATATYQEQPSSFTWSRMIALDGVDISTIDVILLTQYELLLGLPYLTEYLGYQGKIVATEPTIEFARQRMEELVQYRSVPGAAPPRMAMEGDDLTMDWQSIYTLKDIASCIEKIQPVRYNERMVSVFVIYHRTTDSFSCLCVVLILYLGCDGL